MKAVHNVLPIRNVYYYSIYCYTQQLCQNEKKKETNQYNLVNVKLNCITINKNIKRFLLRINVLENNNNNK